MLTWRVAVVTDDVISALKVLPNNRVAKIFIVCLHYEISFFGIFHRFTTTIATKKPFQASLKIGFHIIYDVIATILVEPKHGGNDGRLQNP